MSWISTNNLRRFADNLFHGKLSFSGNVTHNGAVEFNGGVKVNTVKAEFTAPVSFTGTAMYKNNEIATKADIVAGGGITVDDELNTASTNPVQNKVIAEKLNGTLPASSFSGKTHIAWTGDETLDIDAGGEYVTSIEPGIIRCTQDGESSIVMAGNGIGTLDFTTRAVYVLSLGEKLQYGTGEDSVANIATEDYVKANYVQLSNGHISINGSELWIE